MQIGVNLTSLNKAVHNFELFSLLNMLVRVRVLRQAKLV